MNPDGRESIDKNGLVPVSNLSAAIELTLEELKCVVKEIMQVREEVIALRDELLRAKSRKVVSIRSKRRRNFGRLGPGIKTPKEAFFEPVLRALKYAGGSLPRSQVLCAVHKQLKRTLTDIDYERHLADGSIRWTKTCNQARHQMIEDGHLRQGSKKAIWEITDKGLEWLQSRVH